MQTKDLIEKILARGYTKYQLAREMKVSWHCIHAYQKGWYQAGFDNYTKLQMIIEKTDPNQPELFDRVKMHNDEVMNNWLNPKKYKKDLDCVSVL